MSMQLVLFIIFCQILYDRGLTIDDHDQIIHDDEDSKEDVECQRKFNRTSMEFICPKKISFDQLPIDDLNSTILESITFLRVIPEREKKGPLTTIPSNICRLTKLQSLDLSFNRIENLHFNWIDSCLIELRTLKLSNNQIDDISVDWFNQLSFLEHLDLSYNRLTNIPYHIFHNVSHLRTLDVSHNYLTTIELWTVLIQDTVNYASNKIDRFSNEYDVDLSQYSVRKPPQFNVDKSARIRFDDTILSMYNRCAEVHRMLDFSTTYTPTLTLAILSILKLDANKKPFYYDCSCDRFHFYRTALAIEGYPNNAFAETWTCSRRSTTFIQKCNNRSSADFSRVIPRLCKIDQSELGQVPVYAANLSANATSSTPQMPTSTSMFSIDLEEIERRLGDINELDNSTIDTFTFLINTADERIAITGDSSISEETKRICQRIIGHIEDLIESVNSPLNTSDRTVAVISTTKSNPIYHFDQYTLPNSSIIHSSQLNFTDSIAHIVIEKEYIEQLSEENIYSFFFLPSSIFRHAQVDSPIEILSPIVGAHLPTNQSFEIRMSFNGNSRSRSSGSYSCVFWQFDRWNSTGCRYSMNVTTNRHECLCDHLTSFALIFTPDGILPATFLPTIVTSFLSIVGLSLSIILSIYQQIKAQHLRRFSLVNIFSLFATLFLFILSAILLILNHQSSRIPSTISIPCSSSTLNLVLTIYFFVLLTFTSKTLLGIYYYFKTFGDFKSYCLSKQPNRYYFASISMTMIIALLLTITASAISHREDSIIVSKNNICWFRGIYLIGFVTIPISIFISINMIIVLLITIKLCRFLCNRNVNQAKEKRLIVITCVWIASCVLLGVVWIAGPLLNLFVNENGESTSTSSKAMQWIFALFTGLEGVWVLIVNILFFIRHRTNEQSHRSKSRKKWQRIHTLEGPSVNHNSHRDSH